MISGQVSYLRNLIILLQETKRVKSHTVSLLNARCWESFILRFKLPYCYSNNLAGELVSEYWLAEFCSCLYLRIAVQLSVGYSSQLYKWIYKTPNSELRVLANTTQRTLTNTAQNKLPKYFVVLLTKQSSNNKQDLNSLSQQFRGENSTLQRQSFNPSRLTF